MLHLYQLELVTFAWQKGPRLRMLLKLFPVYVPNTTHLFNESEVRRLVELFTGWKIPDSEIFGPYELLQLTLLDNYATGSCPNFSFFHLFLELYAYVPVVKLTEI